MKKLGIISFDLDGTFVDHSFVNAVWLDGVPSLYAKKKGMSLDAAKLKVRSEYDAVGMKRLEWYNIEYWLSKFHLGPENWEMLFRKYKHKISIYPEVPQVLQTLRDAGHKLIVVSNAAREFLNTELEETGLIRHFEHVFSTTSDFNQIKKTKNLYQKILRILDAIPSEVIHIGDDWYFDFEIPRKAGISSFFLDREKQRSGKYVVKDLTEFLSVIS